MALVGTAKFAYDGADSGALSLCAGEAVRVESEEDGWYYGSRQDGTTGFFPATFISHALIKAAVIVEQAL